MGWSRSYGMTDNERMDEIIEVANKISTVAEGHTNAAVLYALINSLAIGIANTSHTEAELENGVLCDLPPVN